MTFKAHPTYPFIVAGTDGSLFAIRGGRSIRLSVQKSGRVDFRSPNGLVTRSARVVICECWHGSKPAKLSRVEHVNGDLADMRPENLRWRDE